MMTQVLKFPQGHSDIHEAVEQFIEQMGLNAQLDGVPRIAGRMAAYFIIHGGPVSFGQLAEALQVSRGSISTNVRMLASVGLIERAAVPGDRQDYYQISGMPFFRMLDIHLERLRRVWHIVDQASQTIPDSMKDTQVRLREMNRFYREAVKSNELLLARLSQDES